MTTVNGFPVVRGSITIPRIGVWQADLLVDTEGLGTGDRVSIDVGDGLVMAGTVAKGGDVRQLSKIHVVGGAGGLSNLAKVKFYRSPLLRVVAGDLARDAGETIATDLGTAGTFVLSPAWTTDNAPTGKVIAALVAAAPTGTVWRMRTDGTLWIGEETWPTVELDGVELEVMPDNDRALLGPFLPTLQPGTVLNGQRIDYVVHRLERGQVRTEVCFHDEARPVATDRVKDSFQALVKNLAGGTFYARFRYRVVKQSEDLKSVDCIPDPDTKEMSGLTNVPIKLGIPGMKVGLAKIKPNAFVLVGFENHDPRRPFVAEWEAGANVEAMTFETDTSFLGSGGAAQAMILGTAYRAAEDTYLTAIVTAVNAALGALGLSASAGATLASAVTAWQTASPTFLSSKHRIDQ